MILDLPTSKALVIYAVLTERARQDLLKEQGKFPYTCKDLANLNRDRCLTILTEEVGEVARVLCDWKGPLLDGDQLNHLREELVQVAAIVLAWLEGLEALPNHE